MILLCVCWKHLTATCGSSLPQNSLQQIRKSRILRSPDHLCICLSETLRNNTSARSENPLLLFSAPKSHTVCSFRHFICRLYLRFSPGKFSLEQKQTCFCSLWKPLSSLTVFSSSLNLVLVWRINSQGGRDQCPSHAVVVRFYFMLLDASINYIYLINKVNYSFCSSIKSEGRNISTPNDQLIRKIIDRLINSWSWWVLKTF